MAKKKPGITERLLKQRAKAERERLRRLEQDYEAASDILSVAISEASARLIAVGSSTNFEIITLVDQHPIVKPTKLGAVMAFEGEEKGALATVLRGYVLVPEENALATQSIDTGSWLSLVSDGELADNVVWLPVTPYEIAVWLIDADAFDTSGAALIDWLDSLGTDG